MNCPYVVCRPANTGLNPRACAWERSSTGESNMTSGDGSDENQRIFLLGFIHCCYDYLGLLWSYDVYVCISGDDSNSTHNATGLREEGLNSGDYSRSLSLSFSLSLTLFFQMKCSASHFSPCCGDDHRDEHSRHPSRFPQEIRYACNDFFMNMQFFVRLCRCLWSLFAWCTVVFICLP